MGRIRTIKPEFPQSESIGQLSREARLLFIQLWTVVDDAGRTRASSRMLASLLYPYDEDAGTLMEGWLAELADNEMVNRYRVDEHSYLEIVNWLKHQKIDHPSESRLPGFREASRSLANDIRNLAPDLGPVPVPSTSTEDQKPYRVKSTTTPAAGAEVPDTADTRCLAESVGIFGMKEQAAMNSLLAVHIKETGRKVQEAIEHMIGRWGQYQNAAPGLEWQYGSSFKFFMSGNWDKPELWPKIGAKPSARQTKRTAWQEEVE